MRRTAPEPAGAVVAHLLGERHQEVGHDLVVERGRRRGPVQMQVGVVVVGQQGRDVDADQLVR